MDFLLDFILHIDQYMVMIVRDYHAWTYAILFFIIFCETGLVVTPFLPGDSLLFVAGAISALPDMPISVHILVIILFAAAVLGDSCYEGGKRAYYRDESGQNNCFPTIFLIKLVCLLQMALFEYLGIGKDELLLFYDV